jgi:hypothetical protein
VLAQEGIFLAREVVEERAPGDPHLLAELLDGEVREPVLG